MLSKGWQPMIGGFLPPLTIQSSLYSLSIFVDDPLPSAVLSDNATQLMRHKSGMPWLACDELGRIEATATINLHPNALFALVY